MLPLLSNLARALAPKAGRARPGDEPSTVDRHSHTADSSAHDASDLKRGNWGMMAPQIIPLLTGGEVEQE